MPFITHDAGEFDTLKPGNRLGQFERVFAGPTITFEDARFDYDEWHFITVGLLAGRVVVLSHTQRGNSLRMISMREGTKREEIRFFKNLRA